MILSIGSSGDSVKFLQTNLNDFEKSLPPIQIDGKFGRLTETKLKAYQKHKNIKIDGIAGNQTFAEIEKDILKKNPKIVQTVTSLNNMSDKVNGKKTKSMAPLLIGAGILLIFLVNKK